MSHVIPRTRACTFVTRPPRRITHVYESFSRVTTKGPRTMTNERQRTTGAIILTRTRAPIPVTACVCCAHTLPSILFSRVSCPTSGQLKIVHESRKTIGIGKLMRGSSAPPDLCQLCSLRVRRFVAEEIQSYSPLFNVAKFAKFSVGWISKDSSVVARSTPWLLVLFSFFFNGNDSKDFQR